MTRPVYEPSLARRDAELGFGQDQLFRRPAPGGAGDLPWARRWLTSNRTIATATLTSISGGAAGTFDDETNNYTSIFDFETVAGQGPGIQVLVDGVYALICRVVCNSLSTPFVIDFNPFLSGDATYELYSYPVYVGQMAVDYRLDGYAAITQRVKANAVTVPMMVHEAGGNRTITEGTYFEMIRLGDATSDDLSWP